MKYLIIIAISVLFVSCLINKKKGFSVYTKPISPNAFTLKTNGVYLSKSHKGGVFFFYKNGIVYNEGFSKYFSLTKPLYVDKDRWGHYMLKGDTIIIQTFGRNDQSIYKRWVIERKGIIINDTSFEIHSWFSHYGKTYMKQKELYKLYKYKNKPDSTKAWFVNKNWYLENLHESRK